jgi:endonuclease/exonuclease/phosphatase family metal-dependent hydrolase
MKLLQLNTWGGVIHYYLLNFLRDCGADIYMMQEVNSSPEGKTYMFNFLQEFTERTGIDDIFFSPRFDFLQMGKRVYHGNAIAARAPTKLRDTHAEFVHRGYKRDIVYTNDTEEFMRMNFQHAVVDMPGGGFVNLINYHGYCQAHGVKSGNDITTRTVRAVADYAAKLKGPVILTGDYNLEPSSVSLAPLNAAYRNLCIEHNITTTRNEYAYPKQAVDYIWVSRDVAVHDFRVLPDKVSDHTALWLDFDIVK